METQVKSSIYLLGSYESQILGAKLPSYRQAFGFFMHLHQVEKKNIRDASRQVIKVLSTFWEKAEIPVRSQQHSILKLEKIFTIWKNLRKHSTRSTLGHKVQEDEFVARFDDLFDIAHEDALTLIKISEDKAFLLSQRQKGRPGSMGAVDRIQIRRNKKVEDRVIADKKRRKKAQQDSETFASQAILASDFRRHQLLQRRLRETKILPVLQ